MKFVGKLVFLLLIAAAGYFLYPHTRDFALAQAGQVEKRTVELSDGSTVILSLTALTQDDFPEQVTLSETVTLKAEDLSEVELAAGEKVRPVGKLGNEVKVEHLTLPYSNLIPIKYTDFETKALDKIAERFSSMKPAAAVAMVEQQDELDRQAGEEAAAEDNPTPEPIVEDEEPEEPSEPVVLDDEGIVAAMRQSLEDSPLESLTIEQVTEMEAAGDEEIDGENFQTGIATYEGETLFGATTLKAKALIKNGKVVRWTSPKSGIELN